MSSGVLRNFNIRVRLYLMIAVTTIILLLPFLIILNQYQEDLMEAKITKTRHLVESTTSILQYFHQQQLDGVLTEQQAQQHAKAVISKQRYNHNDYFWINDATPKMIMHPFKPQLEGKDLSGVKDPTGKALFLDIANTANSGSGEGMVSYMWPKPGADVAIEKVSYVKLFKPWGWIVGSGVYIDDVDALILSRTQSSLTMLAGAIIVMLIFAYLISASIVKPAKATLLAIEDIAQGDGDLTQRLPSQGNDEMAKIADAFNRFVAKIHQTISNIHPMANDVTVAANQLSSLAQDASSKAGDQTNSVNDVSNAMQELLTSNNEVSSSAENAALSARQASEKGSESRQLINDASNEMASLSEALTQADANTQALATETDNVGSVLEVIRGVAEQTNLLALNAAIEAARAGEQGRGFAVVADEVRTLATRTQQSTDEIEQIVTGLQKRAKEVSDSMKKTQQQSLSTLEKAELSQHSLNEVDSQIQMILSMNEQIVSAINHQTNATNHMADSLQMITQISHHASERAQKVAAASGTLKNTGHKLTDSMKTFKV